MSIEPKRRQRRRSGGVMNGGNVSRILAVRLLRLFVGVSLCFALFVV
jgi:hypothetical protein